MVQNSKTQSLPLPADEQAAAAAKPRRWGAELPAGALEEIFEFALKRLGGVQRDATRPVEKDIAMIKHVLRQSISLNGPDRPSALVKRPDVVGQILAEPGRMHPSVVSASWTALQRFIRLTCEEGADSLLAAIEERLVARRPKGWHQSSRVPGGRREGGGRRVRRLLFAVDLLAIMNAARAGKEGQRVMRDQAFVGLCCWSGLKMREICDLAWELLVWEKNPENRLFPIWIRCERARGEVLLPLHKNAAAPLRELYELAERATERRPSGAVFRVLRRPYHQMCDREAREIFYRSLSRAGFEDVRLRDLRAGFAYFLHDVHGIGEMELTDLLGYSVHEHTRNLLRSHRAWELNKDVPMDRLIQDGRGQS